ncbi:hypothetical protein BH09MYX1_BH09MYX1_54740 [soil metagenome]
MPRLRLALVAFLSLAVHGAVVGAVLVHPKLPSFAHEAPPVLAGETFDIAASQNVEPEQHAVVAGAEPAPVPTDRDLRTTPEPGTTAHAVRTQAPPSAIGAATDRPGTVAVAAPQLTYGAVGDRSAVDVAVAFTRSFPQASSADPFWETVPFGDCGTADVTFIVADDGTLESWSAGGAPSEALTRAISRTVALIKDRSFVALGRTTKLRVSARVSPDQTHDGLHGDVFAVGGSYAGGEGNAFFALNIGRRVDVTVRAAH